MSSQTRTRPPQVARAAVPGLPRTDALDGIRAIAAFIVLTVHVGMTAGNASGQTTAWHVVLNFGVGVPIFYTLSGLLLYRPWVKAALGSAPSRPAVPRYLWRRALRILPAYWVVAATALIAFWSVHMGSVWSWVQWLGLIQIYDRHPWWTGLGPSGLGPMWSLATELSFYLALPLIAAVLARLARGGDVDARARRLLYGIGVLILLSFLWVLCVHFGVNFFDAAYLEQFLPRWMGCFGAGMALAVLAEWAVRSPAHPVARLTRTITASPGVFWSVAAALLLLVATPIGTPITPQLLSDGQYLARVVLHPLIAVALIAPMAFPQARPGRLRAFLGSPVMRFLGRISFGIFLWHSIVIEAWDRLTHQPLYSFDFWTLFTVTVAGTLVMATLSYYLIEKPAQRLANVTLVAGTAKEPLQR